VFIKLGNVQTLASLGAENPQAHSPPLQVKLLKWQNVLKHFLHKKMFRKSTSPFTASASKVAEMAERFKEFSA